MSGVSSLVRPPGYELFFAPIEVVLSPNDSERIQFAYFASKYGHADQVRDGGGRYFDHPKAAAWIYISELGGRDVRVIINLLLHDLGEDAYLLSPYRISLNFGEEIALDIHALTKLPKGKETTEEYLGRVLSRGPWAIVAKLCDRLHNLRTLDSCPRDKQLSQIRETRKYHLKILVPSLRSYGAPWEQYANTLKGLINLAIKAAQQP
ncbi:MAG: HD domain-containing protein [Candidatus Paceibacterota bacterium]